MTYLVKCMEYKFQFIVDYVQYFQSSMKTEQFIIMPQTFVQRSIFPCYRVYTYAYLLRVGLSRILETLESPALILIME